ncbi:MAG TPA: hypothetical protein VL049_19085 [Candidatus Dormibacteraeota bacterium]|nr:hypothetical protein [Candidatus Dormibacteraeota bacterium]
MQAMQRWTRPAIALVVVLAMNGAALAVDDNDEFPPPGDDACAGLADEAQGLCNAFCNAQDCPAHPNKNSCVVLRRNFERQTGLSTFPCEDEVITATPSPSRTATSVLPSATPTSTAAATVSATRTRTATPAAPATTTATLTGIPAGTATATRTVSEATTTATAASSATSTAAGTATRTPVEGTDPCAGLSGGAFGLCNAFCNAQNCPADPHPSCEVLRGNFAKQTGSTVFPCEENGSHATPTAIGTTTADSQRCMGDCGGDGVVDISDLTRAMLVVLGERDASECPGVVQGAGASPTVQHMILAVRHALEGCD